MRSTGRDSRCGPAGLIVEAEIWAARDGSSHLRTAPELEVGSYQLSSGRCKLQENVYGDAPKFTSFKKALAMLRAKGEAGRARGRAA